MVSWEVVGYILNRLTASTYIFITSHTHRPSSPTSAPVNCLTTTYPCLLVTAVIRFTPASYQSRRPVKCSNKDPSKQRTIWIGSLVSVCTDQSASSHGSRIINFHIKVFVEPIAVGLVVLLSPTKLSVNLCIDSCPCIAIEQSHRFVSRRPSTKSKNLVLAFC